MIMRLILVLILLCSLVLVSAQDDEPENILNLPAFGFLTTPEGWQPLWDHPYAPAAQSADGAITLRLQSGDTLENPLTVETVGDDAAQVLKSLNLDMIGAPREIHFGGEDGMPLDGLVVETSLDDTTNRLLVLALPPYQEYWYLITLDAPAEDWKVFLPQAENILKTFSYIPNAPLLRVVLSSALPEGAVLRRHELGALEVISQRLYDLSFDVPFTVHLLADQTLEIGFYGGIRGVADVAAWVSQVGFLELVDFSDVELPENAVDSKVLTTGILAWKAANRPAETPRQDPAQDVILINPVTNAPFETIIAGTQFASAQAELSDMGQWQLVGQIAPDAQATLETFTAEHVGDTMAIVLDTRVLMAPRIQASFSEAVLIAGNFSEEEIKRLAALINSGPLPVPMTVQTIEVLE